MSIHDPLRDICGGADSVVHWLYHVQVSLLMTFDPAWFWIKYLWNSIGPNAAFTNGQFTSKQTCLLVSWVCVFRVCLSQYYFLLQRALIV